MINFNHTLMRATKAIIPSQSAQITSRSTHQSENAGLDELLLRAQAEVADIDFIAKIPPKEETAHFASYIQSSGL